MKTYLQDKSNIFKLQTSRDLLVTNKNTRTILPRNIKSRVEISDVSRVSKTPMHTFGEHNIHNASYAYAVGRECGLSDTSIQKALRSFSGLEGRLQHLRTLHGIHIINDNNSTTPEATIAGIKAVSLKYPGRKIILIAGGSDKGLDLTELSKIIKKNCSHTILLTGTGTELLKKYLPGDYTEASKLKTAILHTLTEAKKGDVILFSPGFASFGLFKNEYDRNDQFVKIIQKWK